jgi:hypothetical protein
MLKKVLLLISCLYFLGCSSSIKISLTAKDSLAKHKNIAILPFQISLGAKLRQADKFTEQEKDELRRYLSIALQEHLYDQLKQKQKRFPFTVTVQSAELTNYLLASKKVSFATVFGNDKKEICRILGVDAVICTQTIFGKLERTDLNDVLNRGSLDAYFSIYDSSSTGRLWGYNKNMAENVFENKSGKKMEEVSPEIFYTAEDKYQKILIHWIPTVNAMFQSFTADFPYKKR